MRYLHRIADDVLKERLEAFGAVLVEGPKWCGKTTTSQQIAKSVIKIQDTDMREEYKATAASKPSLLLQGSTPRLIDEWQDIPVIWDAVRTMVDERGLPGQFILTGSNAVDRTKILHSGNSRISRMVMLPMSLWESRESNGKISLRSLFDDPASDIDGITSDMSIEDIIFAACRGGWPGTVSLSSDRAKLMIAENYIDTVCREDISRIDGIARDERIARMILRAYARNISTTAKNTSLLEDITASGEVTASMVTMDDYVTALKKLFVISNIDAWSPAIRSKTAIRSGVIFEQMCIRDLRAYTPDFNTHISYYRDRYGLEADIVLHLSDGRYALIECKLGSADIESGAQHLTELQRLIRQHNEGERQVPLREPDLLIILTGGRMAYTRPDGVKVIPLGCLKN